jgi:hypothetical protein
LRLVAPFLALVRAANAAQEVQRAEDLGEPLQVMVKGRRGVFRRLGLRFLLLRLLLWLRLNRAGRRPVGARRRLLLSPALAPPRTLALKALAIGRNGGRETQAKKKNERDSRHRSRIKA